MSNFSSREMLRAADFLEGEQTAALAEELKTAKKGSKAQDRQAAAAATAERKAASKKKAQRKAEAKRSARRRATRKAAVGNEAYDKEEREQHKVCNLKIYMYICRFPGEPTSFPDLGRWLGRSRWSAIQGSPVGREPSQENRWIHAYIF